MFMPCSDSPVVRESAILACCPALNSPVVNVEALEVGAARAAILLSADDYGALTLWVRVTLIESGNGVTYRYQGDATEFGNAHSALQAAQSFCDGMGFLFDDDLMRDGTASSRRRAMRIWNAIIGASDHAGATSRKPVGPDPSDSLAADSVRLAGPERVLDLDGSLIVEQDADASVLTKLRAKPAKDPAPKRRIRPPSPARSRGRSPEVSGSGELARIELASEELGNEFVDVSGFLTRLLGSF